MPGFLTDADARSRLADVLQIAGGAAALQAWWLSIISDANAAAYNDIQAALAGLSFTAAQIAAWDRGAEFQTDLMLWRALVKGGATKDWDKAFIDALDRRAELLTVAVLNGGVLIEPGDAEVSAIDFGAMSNPTDRYRIDAETWPLPDDRGSGYPWR